MTTLINNDFITAGNINAYPGRLKWRELKRDITDYKYDSETGRARFTLTESTPPSYNNAQYNVEAYSQEFTDSRTDEQKTIVLYRILKIYGSKQDYSTQVMPPVDDRCIFFRSFNFYEYVPNFNLGQ